MTSRNAMNDWTSIKTPIYRRWDHAAWLHRDWSEYDARRLQENIDAVQKRDALALHRECARKLLTVGGRPIFGAFGLIKGVR